MIVVLDKNPERFLHHGKITDVLKHADKSFIGFDRPAVVLLVIHHPLYGDELRLSVLLDEPVRTEVGHLRRGAPAGIEPAIRSLLFMQVLRDPSPHGFTVDEQVALARNTVRVFQQVRPLL